MAIARVVTFADVDASHLEELDRRMQADGRRDDIPATEILVLHDPDTSTSLTILVFENEDDYARSDAALKHFGHACAEVVALAWRLEDHRATEPAIFRRKDLRHSATGDRIHRPLERTLADEPLR